MRFERHSREEDFQWITTSICFCFSDVTLYIVQKRAAQTLCNKSIYICFTEKNVQIRHHANYICICFTIATVNLRQMGTLCVANFSDTKEEFQLNWCVVTGVWTWLIHAYLYWTTALNVSFLMQVLHNVQHCTTAVFDLMPHLLSILYFDLIPPSSFWFALSFQQLNKITYLSAVR